MAEIQSYEVFEKEFKEVKQPMTKHEQARKERILKILCQKVQEVGKHKKYAIKSELAALMDLHMEEIQIIENLSQDGLIKSKPTNEVHQEYQRICIKGGIKPMEQIAFSQFVIKYFDYEIINKKINGKKYRIFISKEPSDWWKK